MFNPSAEVFVPTAAATIAAPTAVEIVPGQASAFGQVVAEMQAQATDGFASLLRRPRAKAPQVSCACGTSMVGKQAPQPLVGRRCQRCQTDTAYRAWIYHCTQCEAVTCKACRVDLVHAGDVDAAVADLPEPQQLPRDQRVADQPSLLDLLRQLPRAYPVAAALWTPRAVQEPVAVVLRHLLAAATRQAEAPLGTDDAELAHLLLLHAPQLILRPVRSQLADDGTVQQPRFAEVIRGRLQKVRQENWLALVQELQSELAERPLADQRRDPPEVETLSAHTAQAAALRARAGALKSAASMLLAKTPVPPGRATDEAVRALFHTAPRDAASDFAFRTNLAASKALPPQRRLRLTYRHVEQQLRATRPGAGPGPSGWRNSHITLLARDHHGTDAVLQWCHVWASGSIAPWLAELWTASLARPFFKDDPDCTKIRPVLCSEALFKLASGAVIRALEGQIQRACGPTQFAASRARGAALHLAQVRAAAAAFPGRVLLSLDVKNAFGAVPWDVALACTLETVPALAPVLTAAWSHGSTKVFTQQPDGHWQPFETTGSLVQGNPEGSPVYCLVAAVVHRRARAELAPRLRGCLVREWSFVDDETLQTEVDAAPAVLDAMTDSYSRAGLTLQEAKCSFHLPSHRGQPADRLPPSALSLQSRIAYAPEGLTLLGTVAASDYEQPLYPGSEAPPQLLQRCQRAVRLTERLVQLVHAAPPAGGKHPAFAIARQVAAHALDFDCSVLPCCLVQPYAEQLDQGVRRVVAACMDMPEDELSGPCLEQTWLPRRLGGLQLSSSRRLCPLARAATVIALGPPIRDCIEAWQIAEKCEPALNPREYDSVAAEGAELVQALADQGVVCLDARGIPQDGAALQPEQLRILKPADHLLSKLIAAAADHASNALLAQATPKAQARIRSAGGQSAGSSLVAPLSLEGVHFADWQLTAVLQARLGVNLVPVGSRQICANRRQDGTACGADLDPDHVHALDCPIGPLRTRRHDDIADEYAVILEECGAIARREAYVHELSDHREAWLDVWAMGVPEIPDLLLDISVRNPMAGRYCACAAKQCGAAAAEAEREKADRYPAAGGREVWPVTYEVFGRAGDQAERLLCFLAAAARRRAHRRGRAAGQELQRWRARIDATLQRGVAAQLLAARVGMPGRRPFRRAPIDVTAIEAGALV